MPNDKLAEALARLREVDADAADEIEEAVADTADLVDSLNAWKYVATKLAKTVVAYRTYSPN